MNGGRIWLSVALSHRSRRRPALLVFLDGAGVPEKLTAIFYAAALAARCKIASFCRACRAVRGASGTLC